MTCDFVNILFVIYAIQRIQQNHRAVIYIFIMAAMIITAVMRKGVVAEIPQIKYIPILINSVIIRKVK